MAETGVVQSYESDPFLAEENDPAKSKALVRVSPRHMTTHHILLNHITLPVFILALALLATAMLVIALLAIARPCRRPLGTRPGPPRSETCFRRLSALPLLSPVLYPYLFRVHGTGTVWPRVLQESCVWEVRALMDHYHPTVARAARALEIPKLGKAEMSIEAVMKSSYASLFEADLQDKHKAECSVTFQPPAQLFVGEAFTEAWTTTPRPEG